MRRTVLPSKYYLTHFQEFIEFVSGPCGHLLDPEDQDFIRAFQALPEDAQCLYVRGLNRKSPIIKTPSLQYDEINHTERHLIALLENGFYYPVNEQHLRKLIDTLTKPELAQVLRRADVNIKSSDSKATYLEYAIEFCDFEHFIPLLGTDNLVVLGYEQRLRYFLFLFFGDLRSGLNKFSMRDLGIMPTRRGVSQDAARFDFIDEAKSAFFYACHRKDMHQLSVSEQIELGKRVADFPSPQGTLANANCDRFLYKLGKIIVSHEPQLGIEILASSGDALAQEKMIRERYKLGEKDWVKQRLEEIIDNPDSEALLTFAEDFLSRKFKQKRTSLLTDMLREQSATLKIDEMHMDSVENGVKAHYQKQGKQVFRTENRLWRALFGLVFWDELFESQGSSLVTEFDYKPPAISQNNFYNTSEQAIETRLYRMTSSKAVFMQLSKVMLEKYGSANGIFRWHRSLLEVLAVFFDHVDVESFKAHMRVMAQDFKTYGDGYPDIMVVDDKGLRFEEIKGPGDQLRKNQLLTIRQLRQHGFAVSITQVEWFLDPLQTYAVVDIETTGGRANHHGITEIGIAKVVGHQVVDTWQTLINPQRHIPRNITQLTGIDNEMVANAPHFVEIADKLREYLAGCVFVAHNVNFDYGFIRAEYERIEQSFRMPKLCTVREMRKAVPGLPSYSLANLTRHFGIDMTRHHRALSDAQAAAELLFIVNESRHKKIADNENHLAE